MVHSRRIFGQIEAEVLAAQVFAALAADESRLARFFALTGLRPDTIRAAVASPDFLIAVLDHVAGDEGLLIDLAREIEVKPETIAEARRILGPAEPPG